MDKTKVIKEIKRLKAKYPDADESLYGRTATLRVLCEDMEEELSGAGLTEETINASQRFIKSNPVLREYQNTTKHHRDAIKQLEATIRKGGDDADDFDKF